MLAVLAGSALLSVGAGAQDVAPQQDAPADEPVAPAAEAVAAPEAATETGAVAPAPAAVTVPRLTPLVIELRATLSSETSVQGDRFPIRLFEPVVINGETVFPAGTTGEGEVIHAKRKGGMGTPGELIITARWLDINGRRVPLRSMRVNGDGQSRIDTVNGIAVASAATIPLASLVGFFITGGAKTVNEGTVATARTAEDFAVPAPEADAQPSAAVVVDEQGGTADATNPPVQDEATGSQQEGID